MTMSSIAEVSFPVSVGGEAGNAFRGHFFPATNGRARVLQVLVHGNTYDHRYWNGPTINGENYSYTEYMNAHGFDVLALDLPGVGASDKPDGHAVTLRETGEGVSRAVAAAREGNAGLPAGPYQHVSLIGHSMGAGISVYAEARWPAADSLVVTGTGFYPDRPRAAWAPGAREALLGAPYALVPPEGRLKFYHSPEADPDVIAFDNEELRTDAPSGLWSDCIDLSDDPAAGFAAIRCPVLLQLGEQDPILPAAYAEQEAAGYVSTSVTIDALPDMGHAFNLHRNRQLGWKHIRAYLDQLTGPNRDHAHPAGRIGTS